MSSLIAYESLLEAASTGKPITRAQLFFHPHDNLEHVVAKGHSIGMDLEVKVEDTTHLVLAEFSIAAVAPYRNQAHANMLPEVIIDTRAMWEDESGENEAAVRCTLDKELKWAPDDVAKKAVGLAVTPRFERAHVFGEFTADDEDGATRLNRHLKTLEAIRESHPHLGILAMQSHYEDRANLVEASIFATSSFAPRT